MLQTEVGISVLCSIWIGSSSNSKLEYDAWFLFGHLVSLSAMHIFYWKFSCAFSLTFGSACAGSVPGACIAEADNAWASY